MILHTGFPLAAYKSLIQCAEELAADMFFYLDGVIPHGAYRGKFECFTEEGIHITVYNTPEHHSYADSIGGQLVLWADLDAYYVPVYNIYKYNGLTQSLKIQRNQNIEHAKIQVTDAVRIRAEQVLEDKRRQLKALQDELRDAPVVK
jgi:hypothetical protein